MKLFCKWHSSLIIPVQSYMVPLVNNYVMRAALNLFIFLFISILFLSLIETDILPSILLCYILFIFNPTMQFGVLGIAFESILTILVPSFIMELNFRKDTSILILLLPLRRSSFQPLLQSWAPDWAINLTKSNSIWVSGFVHSEWKVEK